MFVKPGPHPSKEGAHLRVLQPPHHRPLSAEGRDVPRNHYWMRRLRDGDVVIADPPKSVTEEASAPAVEHKEGGV